MVKSLRKGTLQALGFAARLVHGFLTETSVVEKLLEGGPTGIMFGHQNGIAKRARHVHLSSAVLETSPDLESLLEAAANCPGSRLTITASSHRLLKARKEYMERHGARSKPWLTMRCVVTDAEHSSPALQSNRKRNPNIFCTLTEFADFVSGDVDRSSACPGKWV